MFEGQPKGLWSLALANTGERFGYYTMLAVFALFLGENFGFTPGVSSEIYSDFLMLVYFLPVVGGIAADRLGFGKMVTTGIIIMFLGYLLLAVPLGDNWVAVVAMGAALILVSLGTGLFKGNLQVMVGRLYDSPEYADKRDAGFSLFYMAINIGAMFAPTAAIAIMAWAQNSLGVSKADSYHFAFAVACLSLIVSIAIYYAFRSTFSHVLADKKKGETAATEKKADELSPAETKERVVCLCLVFAVVIFFWMAFHQNGLTLTFFARDYVQTSAGGMQSMMFDVTNLVAGIFIIYALFGLFQSSDAKSKNLFALITLLAGGLLIYKSNLLEKNVESLVLVFVFVCGLFGMIKSKDKSKGETWSGVLVLASCGFLAYKYAVATNIVIEAPIFQQFNPCFVVMLTPVSVALFGWLAKKGKEPTSPCKIGIGMLVAAAAYCLMMVASSGLLAPEQQVAAGADAARVSANWLVSTYLVLTFAELLLSPIGISFVSKVAPPKYAGLMMGLWFAATAIGNKLVAIPGYLWDANWKLPYIWAVLAGICLLSALFIFSIIKKLNKVSK